MKWENNYAFNKRMKFAIQQTNKMGNEPASFLSFLMQQVMKLHSGKQIVILAENQYTQRCVHRESITS